MAYVTYTTEAIVCGSYAHNTSDRSYLLFTREAGMLWATARSVREERSKQRYALQEFSTIRVSLVKGKSGWRVGSVEAIQNDFLVATNRAARSGVVRCIKMLRRFINGEQPLPTVYDDIRQTLLFLKNEIETFQIEHLLQVLELRTLHQLGYVAVPSELQAVIDPLSVSTAVGEYNDQQRAIAERLLEQASRVSHL